MKIQIAEPLHAYLRDVSVQSAVDLLLKGNSIKRVGLEENAPYANQSEYRYAWLAAREIYIEWHALLEDIWQSAWTGSTHWNNARLTELSTLEAKAEEWDLPTLNSAWEDEWYGRIFRTQNGKNIGLYVYADLHRVHLNYHSHGDNIDIDGWEPDDGDFDTVSEAVWNGTEIDLTVFEEPVNRLLTWLQDAR